MSKKEIVVTLAIALAMVPIRVVLATPGLSNWMAERNLGGMQTLLQGSYQISGDFGASVAQAAALLDPGFRAYDRLGDLYPLIGVTWDLDHVQMHPPVEIPLFLPFALISHETLVYKALAYFLPIALLVCLAWSLRLMNVPPFPAWTISVIFAVSTTGLYALQSTYPIVALCFAITWRWRDNPWISGISLAILGAGRVVAWLVAIYFVLTRRLRTLLVAILISIALLVTALIFEPSVLGNFLEIGLNSAETTAGRSDNSALFSLVSHFGWFGQSLALVFLALIAVAAYFRRVNQYWFLVWLSMALSPIAWAYTAAALFPLGAFLWRLGRPAQVLTVLAAATTLGGFTYWGLGWSLTIVLTGLAFVVAQPVKSEMRPTQSSTA